MSEPPVILFSTDYLPNIGGVAAHVHELARALVAMGRWVRVVTVAPSNWREPATWFTRRLNPEGVRGIRLSGGLAPGGQSRGWRWRRALARLLRERRTHSDAPILHVHWGDASFVRTACARLFTNHTSGFLQDVERGNGAQWRERLRVYDWVIAPSRELADKTTQVGFDAQRVSYIPNGVDTDRFKPDGSLRGEARRELGIDGSSIVVLCARRVTPKNGVIDFAHSLRFLPAAADSRVVERVTVVFAGNTGDPRDNYEHETVAAIRQSPVGRRALILGAVPNSSMHRLYAAADISVLPSLKEATSITGLESMACGVPLVATRVGGIPELVDDGKEGLLVEHGDPRALASAVQTLIDNPGLRQAMGARARQRAVEEFDWKCIARRTLAVYDAAKEAHGSRPPRAAND